MKALLKPLAAIALSSALILQACTEYPETAKPDLNDDYTTTLIAEGMVIPWNISWLPNGDMLVTEREGKLRLVRDGKLLPTPIAGLPEIYTQGGGANFRQAGLFEVEPHPDFETNNLLYLTYSAGEEGRNTLALARGRWVDGKTPRLEDVEVIFEADAWRTTRQHYGGRLVWLEDGTLLLTSGEGAGYSFEAQNPGSHFGKILRLTEDGDPAPGNPYTEGNDTLPEIWSMGHRNPQGITSSPEGVIYSNEHGPAGGDEINVIVPGTNYGWPLVTRGRDYSGAQVTPLKTAEDMADPLLHWTPSIAPSSILYYTGEGFPEWQGMLFNSALAGKHIRIVNISDSLAEQISILGELNLRWRDIAQGPDGMLYAAGEDSEGKGYIYRISPID